MRLGFCAAMSAGRYRDAMLRVCLAPVFRHARKKKDPHSLSWEQLLTVQVVVIKQHDEGNKEHGFPYVIAAGIERYPLKVNKRMGAKKLARRSKIKPFVKVCFVSNPR